jgi:hypothetical protein
MGDRIVPYGCMGYFVFPPLLTQANSSYAAGTELTSVNYLTKWWDVSTNVNVYNSKINTSNISNSISQAALWSWFGKFNSNFKLPSNFAVQLTATYQSKTNLPVNGVFPF